MINLRPWHTPRPKPGEYVVDIQWYGEAASVPCKTLKHANKLALSMLPHVGTHAIEIYSVAIYRGPCLPAKEPESNA